MFQTFKYNCIFYCTDISFHQDVLPQDSFIVSHLVNSNINSPDDDLETIEGLEVTNTTSSKDEAETVTETINGRENQTELYRNETHIFQSLEDGSVAVITAKIDLRKSMFPANFWCNFVLGIALVTFIFAAFCTILMAMCSRGGKGRNNTYVEVKRHLSRK